MLRRLAAVALTGDWSLAFRPQSGGKPHALQSYGRPNVNNEEPAATAMYCLPFTAKAIGDE
jgi:hypothetical protein